MSVTVKGQKELEKYIKKVSNADKFFDDDFKKVTRQFDREFKTDTPKDTGNTARGWMTRKLGLSKYVIKNEVVTKKSKRSGRRYNIVRLLDEGHLIRGTRKRTRALRFIKPIEDNSRNLLIKLMLKRIART